jgi:hypothetical protein
MSKDMLGPVIRAAVGIPQDHLDLYAKIGSKLADEEPKARHDARYGTHT